MTDYDIVVVGSGFGGSVSALRLAEKGYRVGVLEADRRFTPETPPKASWDLRHLVWAPRLGLRGMQRITLLRDVVVLSAAGVGGGSLMYANTPYQPPAAFFADPCWSGITDRAGGRAWEWTTSGFRRSRRNRRRCRPTPRRPCDSAEHASLGRNNATC
jgi:cholesterol oxidase